jgi:hypothetical protein
MKVTVRNPSRGKECEIPASASSWEQETSKMENTQEFLNVLAIALVLAFTILITIDLFAGLVNLWNQPGDDNCIALHSLPHEAETEKTDTLLDLKPVSQLLQVNTHLDDCIASTTVNQINTESIALLIQELPQSRLRTAARRLGIADRVDGKYQRLGLLRMQLQTKLKSQPTEVSQVLSGLIVQASKNQQKVNLS